MSSWGTLNFQEAASPLMEQLIMFHDHALVILAIVSTIVTYAMIKLLVNNFTCRTMLESQEVEMIWTILPAVVLIFLALPSLRLLYLLDEVSDPLITFKAVGHQWYWSYEFSDFMNLEFDSYMIPTEELSMGDYRLLEVDHRVVLPYGCNIRALVTSADVLHAWAVPALGLKIDAVPGRLNQLGFYMNRPGVFYGQCSEICGTNHSFMPIVIESVNLNSFIDWILEFSN
uniref:Cytochrome c oxidase subunit 2 n=1 Tax=Loxosomella aloxiata TaxID=393182 RepID=B1B1X0_9BILA|nr:cytochrome c oxidase subunit II [Loxosomella aloxiata]BAG12587.1 cytochrome oxidase subunit II [Loxosomella aloxiata]